MKANRYSLAILGSCLVCVLGQPRAIALNGLSIDHNGGRASVNFSTPSLGDRATLFEIVLDAISPYPNPEIAIWGDRNASEGTAVAGDDTGATLDSTQYRAIANEPVVSWLACAT